MVGSAMEEEPSMRVVTSAIHWIYSLSEKALPYSIALIIDRYWKIEQLKIWTLKDRTI